MTGRFRATESLSTALKAVLTPEVAGRASEVSGQISTEGTLIAARLLGA